MSATPARQHSNAVDVACVDWKISSRSPNGSGNCVEAGPVTDDSARVALRHSRHRNGPAFVSGRAGWQAFVADIKAGTHDC